jgi:hypothetical protein
LHQDKKDREAQWRNSVYVEQGIAGTNGYPAIEIPSHEAQLKKKLEKQRDFHSYLDGQVTSKPFLNNLYYSNPNKTMNQFYSSRFSLASQPENIAEFQ